MKNLYLTIKQDLLKARQEKVEDVKKTLSVILAEADKDLISRKDENEQHSLMTTIVQKYEKQLLKAIEQFKDKEIEKEYQRELEIIAEYLPKKLSTEELAKVLSDFKSSLEDGGFNIGSAMKFLNQHYKDLYIPAEAKRIIAQLS